MNYQQLIKMVNKVIAHVVEVLVLAVAEKLIQIMNDQGNSDVTTKGNTTNQGD